MTPPASPNSKRIAQAAEPTGDWQTMETAPRDGTPIQARIPGHGDDAVIAWTLGFENEDGSDCGTWAMFDEDQKPPASWTDGVCWASNAEELPSVGPTHWRPLPAQAAEDGGRE